MDGKMRRILVADDEEDTLMVIKQYLESKGFEVCEARDGQIVLDLLEKYRPDLILLDVMMPVMDGFTLNRRLKQNPELRNIPVIVTTAKTRMKEMFASSPDSGVDFVLEKPFRLAQLLECVQTVLLKKTSSDSE